MRVRAARVLHENDISQTRGASCPLTIFMSNDVTAKPNRFRLADVVGVNILVGVTGKG